MLFPSSRSGSGRQRSRQSLRFVSWPLRTLRSLLIPCAHPAYFFSLPMDVRGQGKEMSFFQKTRRKVPFVEIFYKFFTIMTLQQVTIENMHKKQEVTGL
jgi:hypothetical protein